MNFFIKNGFISKTKNSVKTLIGNTDLLHILKQMLNRLGVAWVDSCCPVTGVAPMRTFVTSEGDLEIQVYDYVMNEWVSTMEFASRVEDSIGYGDAYLPPAPSEGGGK